MATTSAPIAAQVTAASLNSNEWVFTRLIISLSSIMSSIQIATRAADQFTRLYYSTYDSATRTDDLPKFYRDSSSLTWNGRPYQGVAGVKDLIQNMPPTVHEVQSFDCHPIPGL